MKNRNRYDSKEDRLEAYDIWTRRCLMSKRKCIGFLDWLDSDMELKPIPCPICGELPEIRCYDGITYSRSKKTAGREFTSYVCHWCSKQEKRYSIGGKPMVAWGNFNAECPYKTKEILAAEDESKYSAIRRWNKSFERE